MSAHRTALRDSSRGFTLIELLVCMVLFLICSTLTLAAVVQNRQTKDVIKCAVNLRQIGQALLLYANDNRGKYPRTSFAPGDNPVPTWGTPYEKDNSLDAHDPAYPFPVKGEAADAAKLHPADNDVTAALFLLLRTEDITSEVFVCPSTRFTKWDFGGGKNNALNWTNWKGNAGLRDHLSYSYQNPYPSNAAISQGFMLSDAISPHFVIAADMNPGTDDLLKLTPTVGPDQMRAGNSLNHRGDGQNVLFGDGHVAFETSPFVGPNQDNIYTAGESGKDKKTGGDKIIGSSIGPMDSVLLPTAKDIGTKDVAKPEPKPMAADEVAKLGGQLVGKYQRPGPGGRAMHLEITPTDLISKRGPMTLDFQYKVTGGAAGALELKVTATDTPADEVSVTIGAGTIEFTGGAFYGIWTKER